MANFSMSLAIAPPRPDACAEATLIQRPRSGPDGLACWIARPRRIDHSAPPIVAVHGLRRNARQQADLFATRAAAAGRIVIAPLFEEDRWPRYQQVVRRGRADLALLALLSDLRRDGLCRTEHIELFGYSGGAQFVHRFAMLHPQVVARLTVASAGWYTFPDEARFPYGLAPRPDSADPWQAVTDARFRQFLALPMQVCAGADDCVRDDNTRSGPMIDAQQGTNRLVRAMRWRRAIERAAREAGITPRISFIALSACGHSFSQCVESGGLGRIVMPDGPAARQNSRTHSQTPWATWPKTQARTRPCATTKQREMSR